MAGQITGKFVADFASFNDAVNKAVVQLKGMETGASKVQTSLDRMVDQFSGRKVIQEATLMVQAFELLATKGIGLTTKELQRMGVVADEAIAKLKAGGEQVPAGLQQISDAAAKVNTSLTEVVPPVSKLRAGFADLVTQVKATALGFISAQAIIGGVQSAFRGLVGFVSSSVDAYAESEAANKKLTAALTAQGLAIPGLATQYANLASQFQNTTVFADELITEMQALLVQIGDVMPHEMNEALKAATNLSSGLGIELRQATMLVAKAFSGSGEELGRLKQILGDAVKPGADMAEVLEAINEKFGGQAQADAEGYAGKIKSLGNAWSELKEAIGKSIAENDVVIAAIRELTKALKSQKDAADASGKQAKTWAESWNDAILKMFPVTAQWIALQERAKAANEAAMEAAKLAKFQADVGKPMAVHTPEPPPRVNPKKEAEDRKKALEAEAKAVKQLKQEWDAYIAAALKRGDAEIKLDAQRVEGIKNVNEQMDTYINTHLKDLATRGQNILRLTTDETVKLGLAWMNMGPAIEGISNQFINSLGPKAHTGIKPVVTLIKESTVGIDDLSKALSQLATVAGGTFGAMASGLATMVSAANTAKIAITQIKDAAKTSDKFEGLLGMATGITGIVSAALAAVNAIKGIWGAINQREGRHAVEDFADSFGGFDALHAKLLELGDAGEQLWIKLTQGVPAGNAEAAARVIAEIEAALAKQADAVDEVTTATEEQAQATIETASQAAKALEELGPRIDANKDEWKSWGDVVTAQIQRIADAVRALPMPGGGLPSAAAITNGSNGHNGSNITVVSMLDGRQIAKSTARYLPDALEGIA